MTIEQRSASESIEFVEKMPRRNSLQDMRNTRKILRNDTCARDVNSGNNSALVARNAQTQIDFLRSAGAVHLRTMRLIFRMNFDEQISLIT